MLIDMGISRSEAHGLVYGCPSDRQRWDDEVCDLAGPAGARILAIAGDWRMPRAGWTSGNVERRFSRRTRPL